ncbi:hypothetical protein PO909_016991 [Leuciscus waleckii]
MKKLLTSEAFTRLLSSTTLRTLRECHERPRNTQWQLFSVMRRQRHLPVSQSWRLKSGGSYCVWSVWAADLMTSAWENRTC